jgi:spore coat protein U-like protein
MKRLTRQLFVLIVLLAAAAPGLAATATSTVNVTATVAAACNIVGSTVPFGTGLPSPVASPIDVQGGVGVTCASGTAYSVAANAGNGAGATFAARRMRMISGTALLTYALYTDAGRTTVWGDGTGGSSVIGGIANGTTQQIPVYGRIPSGQTPLSGTYFDLVTVTVTF